MLKPLPIPDPLTQPFWDAANNERLVIQRCQDCKHYQHPPAGLCPDCRSTRLQFEPVSGKGAVYTYTITRDARHPAFEELQPYPVAVVELAEQPGLFMLSNLPGVPIDQVRIGMPVTVTFETVGDRRLPQFRSA